MTIIVFRTALVISDRHPCSVIAILVVIAEAIVVAVVAAAIAVVVVSPLPCHQRFVTSSGCQPNEVVEEDHERIGINPCIWLLDVR